jgi:cytochrome P450
MTVTLPQGLKKPRGPVLGLAHLLQLRYHPITHNQFLREAYGDLYTLSAFGVRMHVTAGADAAEQVLVNRDRDFASGPAWSHFIGPFFHRGLMLLDFDEHLHHRRILQHAFTNDALRSYHAVMTPHVRAGLEQWAALRDAPLVSPHADALRLPPRGDPEVPRSAPQGPGNIVRLHHQFKALTLDLALETFVGVDLTPAQQEEVNRAFIAAVRAGTSLLRKPVPGTPWAKGLRARAFLEDFFRTHIPAKRRDGGDDLFAQLCRARIDEGAQEGAQFSDDDIVNHMIFLLMAAHDTTTITLSSIAYHLAKHPEWQERARAESIAAGDVDYDGVLGLEVLDRVMKESLRLCAPVPTLPRVAVRDTAIQGYFIPAGSFVSVSPYMNHYLPELWKDPDRFDPDRFAPDRREDRSHRMAFEPFGGGVHKCIGMHFAGMQVRAILHEMLRSYRWSVPDDYVWPIDLTALPFPRDGIPVQLERL